MEALPDALDAVGGRAVGWEEVKNNWAAELPKSLLRRRGGVDDVVIDNAVVRRALR